MNSNQHKKNDENTGTNIGRSISGILKSWLGQTSTSETENDPSDFPEPDKNCNPYRLPENYPAPREILKVHFPKYADELCFSGGWGYSQKTATVVREFDPEINPTEHFDGISLENVFIQKRIWEELKYARPEGERFIERGYAKTKQQLVFGPNGIPYDLIEVSVAAYSEKDWNELKEDWESHKGYQDDPEGREKHIAWNKRCKITFTDEFWFDISDFFGK